MGAITMAATNSLVKRLGADFAQLRFVADDDFRWSPDEQTVYFPAQMTADDIPSLLHETAHGLLGHQAFIHDVDLLKMEREAWDYARRHLAAPYAVVIDSDMVEDALDTYRTWLHDRSLCPECGQNGVQQKHGAYQCLACQMTWRPNDARRCALRRYRNPKTPA